MSQLQVFYSIYVPPGRERLLLDAIRLFANPHAKHAAHITVRGPYPDYVDPRTWSAAVKGKRIDVAGVGTFFGRGQNTVFLCVDSAALREILYKPDYPAGPPHLTIYDGDSRQFADGLRSLLEERRLSLTFQASGVEPMVSGNGPPPLRTIYDPSELAEFVSAPPTLEELESASDETRLLWIAELADHLSAKHCATA